VSASRRIVWSNTAIAALEEAVAYLRREDERAANNLVAAIEQALDGLASRNTGRSGRVEGTFEK
jgi:plasmid stabilization system protein ParE